MRNDQDTLSIYPCHKNQYIDNFSQCDCVLGFKYNNGMLIRPKYQVHIHQAGGGVVLKKLLNREGRLRKTTGKGFTGLQFSEEKMISVLEHPITVKHALPLPLVKVFD